MTSTRGGRRAADKGSHVYAVILVGGRGKRLRPLSTDERPKAFLSITRDRRSMFARTLARTCRVVPRKNIFVVANRMHGRLVRRDFPDIGRGRLILEPVSRNTAPAAALAVKAIHGIDPDAIVAVMPTDHYIRDEAAQARCAKAAHEFMRGHPEAILVFGMRPTFASTQYGYVKIRNRSGHSSGMPDHPAALAREAGIKRRSTQVVKVEAFVEKPDGPTAKRYVESGAFLWNSGAFVFTSRGFLGALKKHANDIWRCLKTVDRKGRGYERMPDISLDYAIMEKAKNIYCMKGSYGWSDVGSFAALRKVLRRESRKFAEAGGKIMKIL
jgi:mannose-1-phosphate guanylyltransferase